MSKTPRAKDRAEPDPAGGDDAVGNRVIGAGVDLHPGIGELPAMRRNLRADPPAQAKAAGRVEQAVAAVIAKARRQARQSGKSAYP